MFSLSKQLLFVFILIALLTAAAVADRWGDVTAAWDALAERFHPRPPVTDPVADAVSRYGFALQEKAADSGVTFVHHGPSRLDPKLRHIQPIVAAMGASVSIVDFDNDGWPDIFVTTGEEGGKCALYRNQHDGTFKDVAAEVGLADLNQEGTGVCMGAVWGDFDDDGYEDVLVYKWGRPVLLHNDAGKHFTPVPHEKSGLPDWMNANSALWFDYDRDGHLDLFIAGYWRDDLDLWHLRDSKVMPDSFEYATNGGSKHLLHNNGDGTFTDVTEKMGIKSKRWTLAVGAAQLCGSGYPDLFLANDYGVSEIYANREGKKFEEIGQAAGVQDHPRSGMNASFGDVNNTGRFSVYVSNISEPGQLVQGNCLWMPMERRPGRDPKYLDLANPQNVQLGGWSWGAQFVDLNNDGLLDLYLTNGYISADRDKSYWFEYSKIAGANEFLITDAANWPAIHDRSLSGYQPKHVWLNKGGSFVEIAAGAGVRDQYDGRAVATADLWNRGVQDVIVANQNGPLLIYKNTVTPDNHWLQFELTIGPKRRPAIGAEVRLYWDGKQQLQAVSGGDGYASQRQRRLHFGLGKSKEIDKVVIQWPSGKTQTIEHPEADKLHTIQEAP
ncbi:MAG TPA: CRTAC1 family protein [Gemmataceae bacterium]|nr:CRTAC1 family protein [Gemmataceae bacterium]